MDLFVVNRHVEEEPIDKCQVEDEESKKLAQTLSRIERNKKLRTKHKEKEQKVKEAIKRTTERRQAKRIQKAKIVHVPENDKDEFIDRDIQETIIESLEEKVKNKRKRKGDIGHVEGFTILGVDNHGNKAKARRVLPKWLANPTIISVNLAKFETKVTDLEVLDEHLQNLLKHNGVEHFFPVQAEVIPWVINANKFVDIVFPRDICVSAPTGSGKTLAFVLPVIQVLKKYQIKRIRALVILPTQDLARQVFQAFKTYSEGTDIDVALITGQQSFEVEQKQLVTKNEAFGFFSKVDILVCTAGRLVDHLKMTEGLNFDHLDFLIIDEADRVLENVQNDWLYHLETRIYPEGFPKILNLNTLEKRRPPQKLLFSATLSQDPEKLQQLSLFQPKLFTSIVENTTNEETVETNDKFIGKYTTPKELTERYIETSVDLKPLVLYKFIKQENLKRTLVFTHSAQSAHRLTILLSALFENELQVHEISSQLQPKNRAELIEKFSTGQLDVLISTDALARGIDLPGVECVISYSAPKYLKSYIHRAGRTARAGEKGLAVTFLHSSQLPIFKTLLKQAGKTNVDEIKILEEDLEELGGKYKDSLQKLKDTVEKEDKGDLRKIRQTKRAKAKLKKKIAIQTHKKLTD